jgi:hypothetical protein
MSKSYSSTRTIRIPAGNQKTTLLTNGNFLLITASAIAVNVAFVGNDMNDIMEFRRNQGIKKEGEFQKLEFWRSENDPNPDLPYDITVNVGSLSDNDRLFF